MSIPLTAPAAEKPCELYKHTRPPFPLRTQGHHRLPQYLQKRVWGEVRDNEDILWVCGLCHDALGEWIAYLLKEGRRPDPFIEGNFRREAEYTVARYERAMRDAHE
jgi:hypothetical protein